MDKIINLLKKEKNWIKASLLIFLIALFLGIITFFFRGLPFLSVITDSISKISELGGKARASDDFGRFILIYKNNLISMAMIIFGGIIFGIFTLIGLFVNGLLLGFFSLLIFSAQLSINAKAVLFLTLLPHGIIEIFLLIVSSGWGLKLGLEHFLPQSKGKRFKVFLENLKNSFYIFLFLAVGLALAAFLEVLDMKIVQLLVE